MIKNWKKEIVHGFCSVIFGTGCILAFMRIVPSDLSTIIPAIFGIMLIGICGMAIGSMFSEKIVGSPSKVFGFKFELGDMEGDGSADTE